jgi:hypothetical protein
MLKGVIDKMGCAKDYNGEYWSTDKCIAGAYNDEYWPTDKCIAGAFVTHIPYYS